VNLTAVHVTLIEAGGSERQLGTESIDDSLKGTWRRQPTLSAATRFKISTECLPDSFADSFSAAAHTFPERHSSKGQGATLLVLTLRKANSIMHTHTWFNSSSVAKCPYPCFVEDCPIAGCSKMASCVELAAMALKQRLYSNISWCLMNLMFVAEGLNRQAESSRLRDLTGCWL
jgi:hypothetical protein